MSAPGQVGAGWGLRVLAGALVALLCHGASLEACPRGICPHSWNWAFSVGAMGCSCRSQPLPLLFQGSLAPETLQVQLPPGLLQPSLSSPGHHSEMGLIHSLGGVSPS